MAGSDKSGAKDAGAGGKGRHVLTVLSATALIATEAVATAVAAGWALAGLTNLGDLGEYALMGLFSLAALYVSLVYFRRAYRVEMQLPH